MDDRLFNRQFLLSNSRCDALGWTCYNVGDYYLYVHPNLECTIAQGNGVELVLLGYLFDYQAPESSNQDLLNGLTSAQNPDTFFQQVDTYSGQFVLIYRCAQEFILCHDAGGQQEIYYNSTFSVFASQPKLLQEVISGIPVSDPAARQFYTSEAFLQSKIFIGNFTHLENIRHLQPNHCIDLNQKKVLRYFPRTHVVSHSVVEAADGAIKMLTGFLKAASLRYQLEIGVTAGYDSRILFLASLGIDCTYYISKNNTRDNATDIRIAKQLAELHNRPLSVRTGKGASLITDDARKIQDLSIDFPRYRALSQYHRNAMVVNGNISEIARSYYGTYPYRNGSELARAYGIGGSVFAQNLFDSWLADNRELFDSFGYDYRDMFYWEEKIGNWAAKGKTEAALNKIVYSPFCSRRLLELLLSTARMHRDKHFNHLYDTMITRMSPRAMRIPINPDKKTRIIKAMKRVGIYSLYRKAGIRLKLLKS